MAKHQPDQGGGKASEGAKPNAAAPPAKAPDPGRTDSAVKTQPPAAKSDEESIATHAQKSMPTQQSAPDQPAALTPPNGDVPQSGNIPTPPPLPASYQRIEDFQTRAIPIIAQHGVGTPKSTVLLKTVQKELELSNDEFDAAMERLKARSKIDDAERRHREEFTGYAEGELQRLQGRLLTGKAYDAIVAVGVDRFSLQKRAAKKLLAEIIRRNSIQYVSTENARQLIHDRAQLLLSEEEGINRAAYAGLVQRGGHMGLTRHEVDAAIRRIHGQGDIDRRRTVALLGGCIVVGLGLIVFLLYAVLLRPSIAERDIAVTPPVPPHVDPGGEGSETTPDIIGDCWWQSHTELMLAVYAANRSFDWFQELQDELCDDDPERRSKAYERLIRNYDACNGEDAQILARLIGDFFAQEPEDQVAARLADSAFKRTVQIDDPPPKHAATYSQAFKIMGLSSGVFEAHNLGDARTKLWSDKLSEVLGIPVDPNVARTELLAKYYPAMTRHIYEKLIRNAQHQPNIAYDAHALLSRPFVLHVDKATQAQLETRLLVVLLPSAGADWRKYEEMIFQSVHSSDATHAAALVDILEKISHPQLQTYLAQQLLWKVGEPLTEMPATDVARIVRDRLGVRSSHSPDVELADRWDYFNATATSALESLSEDGNPSAICNDALRLVHLAALGAALSRGEFGAAQFDEIRSKSPKQMAPSTSDGPASKPSGPAATPTVQFELERSIKRFQKLVKLPQPEERVRNLRKIVTYTSRVADLPYPLAKTLANYIMLRKRVSEEHLAVTRNVSKLARWPQVRLAMVDKFRGTSTFDVEQISEVLNFIVPGKVHFEKNTKSSRQAARIALLESVASESAVFVAADKDPSAAALDRTATSFRTYYQMQARTFGVAETVRNYSAAAQQLLKALVELTGNRLGAEKLDPSAADQVAQIQSQLRIATYLADDNDLAATVYLQRLWIRLLAIQVAQYDVGRKEDAGKLVEDLDNRDRKATDLLSQLRDGEAAIVRMWLLRNRPD